MMQWCPGIVDDDGMTWSATDYCGICKSDFVPLVLFPQKKKKIFVLLVLDCHCVTCRGCRLWLMLPSGDLSVLGSSHRLCAILVVVEWLGS